MNIMHLLIYQLVADAVLCIAVVFLFAVVNREIKTRGTGFDPKSLADFSRLIAESQVAAENLLKAMDDSRRILKEISYAIDEKERRLKGLMDASEAKFPVCKEQNPEELPPLSEDRYEKALQMAAQGLKDYEIAERSGLTEGEIRLIMELNRKKNESV
jgi:DNA-binding NarL/FixJ family response regulator